MAIELISTITTKNNGGYAIALSNEIKGGIHSKNTIEERDSISINRLQEGMLCYVSEEKEYYQWIEGEWKNFTVSSDNNNNIMIYRVDTYEDMLNINSSNLKNGFFCHVLNDKEGNNFYYYNNGKWSPFNSKHQVWIGVTPPVDKTCLWIDTRNMVIDGSFDDITIDTYPTFIDTSLIQYMKEQIQSLNNKIKELQKIIQNDNSNNEDDDLIIEDVIYTVKGGRLTTTIENERILNIPITQATIYNESPNEINIIVNEGEVIPLSEGESLCFGNIEIESIIILEKGSTVKYIGI